MDTEKLTEARIVELVKEFLVSKPDGNWHEDKVRQASGHSHGPDLVLTGGRRNSERFIIECKGKSYAKSANSLNKEGWLNALGQLVTRMHTARTIRSGETKGSINRARISTVWDCTGSVRRSPCGASRVRSPEP